MKLSEQIFRTKSLAEQEGAQPREVRLTLEDSELLLQELSGMADSAFESPEIKPTEIWGLAFTGTTQRQSYVIGDREGKRVEYPLSFQ